MRGLEGRTGVRLLLTFSRQEAALLPLTLRRQGTPTAAAASRARQLVVQVNGPVVAEEVQLAAVGAGGSVVTREVAREVQVCARGWFGRGTRDRGRQVRQRGGGGVGARRGEERRSRHKKRKDDAQSTTKKGGVRQEEGPRNEQEKKKKVPSSSFGNG